MRPGVFALANNIVLVNVRPRGRQSQAVASLKVQTKR